LNCAASKKNTEAPLVIIDGVLCENVQFQKLNPDDIVSIEVLKSASFNIVSCRPAADVIIITTKEIQKRKFIIKDNKDSSIISGATISLTEKNNTIKGAADDKGVFAADKLKRGVEYEMIVSSVGYKTIKTSYTTNFFAEQEIFMEKDLKTNDEVVVVSYVIRCGRCGRTCWGQHITSKEIKAAEKSQELIPVKSIYPNPVQRNNVFNLEFKNEKNETLQLSVAGFDGRTVMIQPQKVIDGLNRISIIADPRWTAGVYIVLVKNEKGNVIKQDKLVVQ
jgi:hypothetical protein